MPELILTTNLFGLPYPVGFQYGAAATQALAEAVAATMWKTRLDYMTISGSLWTTTSAGADAVILFGQTFAAPPDVIVTNAEIGYIFSNLTPWNITTTQCWVRCVDSNKVDYPNGDAHLIWMARGFPA